MMKGIKMSVKFVLNETSYHGKGAISAIADEIKARGFKKAFVCSDPDLIKFGVTKKVIPNGLGQKAMVLQMIVQLLRNHRFLIRFRSPKKHTAFRVIYQ